MVPYQPIFQMFFFPSTTDHIEDINRYMEFVNLSPIDIAESSFETEDGVSFDLSKLDRKKQ